MTSVFGFGQMLFYSFVLTFMEVLMNTTFLQREENVIEIEYIYVLTTQIGPNPFN